MAERLSSSSSSVCLCFSPQQPVRSAQTTLPCAPGLRKLAIVSLPTRPCNPAAVIAGGARAGAARLVSSLSSSSYSSSSSGGFRKLISRSDLLQLVVRAMADGGAGEVQTGVKQLVEEKLGVKIERNPSESRLSELGIRSWPKYLMISPLPLSLVSFRTNRIVVEEVWIFCVISCVCVSCSADGFD